MSAPVQPDSLRASLRPLAAAQPLTAEQQAYQAFYQLNRLGVQTRLGCFQVGGYQIAVQLWLPEQPRATLIVQHGYYDHMGLYRHLIEWALGMGFADTIRDFQNKKLEERRALGVNDSMIHEDFMIGSADLSIDAVCDGGKVVPIFRNGTWAF